MVTQQKNRTELEQFEFEFAKLTGNKYVVPVCNGSVALIASLKALGVGEGVRVAVPAFTFVAVADAVLWCNGTPVFKDISPETYCMLPDTEDCDYAIAVHSFGNVCELPKSRCVIEDCSQNLFANVGGALRTYSFYRTKQLNLGEGGAVASDNESFVDWVRQICNHGRKGRHEFERLGSNFRMSPIVAGLGVNKIRGNMYKTTYEGGGVQEGFYPYVIYDLPEYRRRGLRGDCPNAERLAEKLRKKQA